MFYSIALTHKNNYPDHYQLGPFAISTDPGWHQQGNYLFKGYMDQGRVQDNLNTIVNQPIPTLTGNFTVLYYDAAADRLKICSDRYRGYQLRLRNKEITNLEQDGDIIWVSDVISINKNFTINYNKFDVVGQLDTGTLTADQAQDKIKNILTTAVDEFYNTSEQLNLFCTGGIDTLLIYAMLSGRKFNLIDYEYYKLDQFTIANKQALSKFWTYNQIHHWDTPTVLATGSHGDEYTLRGPPVIAMLTAWHNINFAELLSANPDCYHYKHFNKYQELWQTAWESRRKLQQKYHTRQDLNREIVNNLTNDHQHWHLGETITWTPFKNINIVKILLQCPIEDLLPQFLHAQITKNLIAEYNPNVLKFLSTYKNYNAAEYLPDLYKQHNRCI